MCGGSPARVYVLRVRHGISGAMKRAKSEGREGTGSGSSPSGFKHPMLVVRYIGAIEDRCCSPNPKVACGRVVVPQRAICVGGNLGHGRDT